MRFIFYLAIAVIVGVLLRAFSFQISRFMESAFDWIECSAALRKQRRISDSREQSCTVDVRHAPRTPSVSLR